MTQPRAILPRAVLFDWDNTLVDSWPAIHRALNLTMDHFGLPPWSQAETHLRVRHSLRDSFPTLFGERWQEARDVYLASFAAIHLETLAPLPGVADMFAALRERGILLGVVSNKTGRFLRLEGQHLGWETHFAAMVGAGDAREDKPSAAPVHLALEGTGIPPGPDVWFVGDTGLDLLCAHNSGCVPILLGVTPLSEEERALHPPRWVFEDCMRFMSLVRELGIPISKPSCY